MRLSGQDLRCVRGGREVFSGLDFAASAGELLAITGANGSGKTSLLRVIAGLLVAAGGSVELEGGGPELSLAEQAHYLGHRDALKPALSVAENLSFWRDFLGGEMGASASPRRASITPRICRPPISRLVSAGGCRSRGCSWFGGPSGCWTNPLRRSTRRGKPCSSA